MKLSFHTALVIRPESASLCSGQSSQLSVPWLLPQTSPNDATPSLHAHYSRFYTTTSGSAPAPCFDTLASRVGRFRLLSWHQGNRFPSSISEPVTESRHFYAGCHVASNQVSATFISGVRVAPDFDNNENFTTLTQWFTRVRLSVTHLTALRCLLPQRSLPWLFTIAA